MRFLVRQAREERYWQELNGTKEPYWPWRVVWLAAVQVMLHDLNGTPWWDGRRSDS